MRHTMTGRRCTSESPALSQTIARRWRQHLSARAGGSALRRSLGVYLNLVDRKLTHADGRYYPPDVEQRITAYLNDCDIELHATSTADEADDLELRLIAEMNPILNISRARRRKASRT